jgi:prepilin peptidase dependent protein B
MHRSSLHAFRRQRGLSLVEMLVGVVVGLFIVGGATKLVVDNLHSNRRNLLETRVNQDLRAAADLIARDLRRAGYWQNSINGIWSTAGVAPTPNPHRTVTKAGSAELGTLAYSYAKNNNNSLDAGEQFGYQVASGVLQYQVASGNAQPVTDPNSVLIDANGFAITETQRSVELSDYCTCMVRLTCTAADFAASGPYTATRPLLLIRQFDVRLRGTSATDTAVTRELRETVRVRNDEISGTCPAI